MTERTVVTENPIVQLEGCFDYSNKIGSIVQKLTVTMATLDVLNDLQLNDQDKGTVFRERLTQEFSSLEYDEIGYEFHGDDRGSFRIRSKNGLVLELPTVDSARVGTRTTSSLLVPLYPDQPDIDSKVEASDEDWYHFRLEIMEMVGQLHASAAVLDFANFGDAFEGVVFGKKSLTSLTVDLAAMAELARKKTAEVIQLTGTDKIFTDELRVSDSDYVIPAICLDSHAEPAGKPFLCVDTYLARDLEIIGHAIPEDVTNDVIVTGGRSDFTWVDCLGGITDVVYNRYFYGDWRA